MSSEELYWDPKRRIRNYLRHDPTAGVTTISIALVIPPSVVEEILKELRPDPSQKKPSAESGPAE